MPEDSFPLDHSRTRQGYFPCGFASCRKSYTRADHLIRRLKFISQGNSTHWNALLINSRQQELLQVLQHFRRICYEGAHMPGPEIFLPDEVTLIFLFISLEELQLFTGKEDQKEARRVYHNALEWINSADSRRAIWHAGQVIRAARAMPPGSLTGFLAVEVSMLVWRLSRLTWYPRRVT